MRVVKVYTVGGRDPIHVTAESSTIDTSRGTVTFYASRDASGDATAVFVLSNVVGWLAA